MRIAHRLLVALAACCAVAAQAQAPRAPTLAALAGKWRVAAVVPSSGVGIFAKNDPAYMNRMVQVSAKRVAWAPGAKMVGGSLDEVCTGPSLRPAPRAGWDDAEQLRTAGVARPEAFTIGCRAGSWGPAAGGGARLYPIDADTVVMTWYDGGVFRLVRAR